MVWHVLVPGAHTVTDTFGILTKFCAPGPTVIGTVFDAVDAIGCALVAVTAADRCCHCYCCHC